MAYGAGFTIDDRELDANLDGFEDQVHQFITLATEFAGEATVKEMKVKAPWTDRTGAARNGLHYSATHNRAKQSHDLTFAHGVDYGIWLEVANSGKYAIIIPTVLAVGKEIMAALSGMLNHLDSKPPTPTPNIDVVPAKARKGAASRAQAKYAASKSAKGTKKTRTTSRTKRS